MKLHHILKDFPGSQHGNDHQQFKAGAQEPLSDSLAAVVVPLGWAKPVLPEPVKVVTPVRSEPEPEIPVIEPVVEEKAKKAPFNKMKKPLDNK